MTHLYQDPKRGRVGDALFSAGGIPQRDFRSAEIRQFGHGAFYLLGAYLTYDLTQRDFILWLAIPLAAPIVAGVVALTEAVLLRRRYMLPHTVPILVTLGIALVIQEFVIIVWGPLGGSVGTPDS